MPARDIFHDTVVAALRSDGWIITDDPYTLRFGLTPLYIDLAAEKLLAAEKDGQRIAVEIKSFRSPSRLNDFHTALGQFINYADLLADTDPRRVLWLAIPTPVWEDFFALPAPRATLARHHINTLVFNPIQPDAPLIWNPQN